MCFYWKRHTRLTERKSKCFKIAHFSFRKCSLPAICFTWRLFSVLHMFNGPNSPFQKIEIEVFKILPVLDPNPSAIQSFCCCCKQQENRDYFFYVVVKNIVGTKWPCRGRGRLAGSARSGRGWRPRLLGWLLVEQERKGEAGRGAPSRWRWRPPSSGGNCRIEQPCQAEVENLRAARFPGAKWSSGRGAAARKCNLDLERCIVKLFLWTKWKTIELIFSLVKWARHVLSHLDTFDFTILSRYLNDYVWAEVVASRLRRRSDFWARSIRLNDYFIKSFVVWEKRTNVSSFSG